MPTEPPEQKYGGGLFWEGGMPSANPERQEKVAMFKEEKRYQHGWTLVRQRREKAGYKVSQGQIIWGFSSHKNYRFHLSVMRSHQRIWGRGVTWFY